MAEKIKEDSDASLDAFLWKIVLTSLTSDKPNEWCFYVISDNAVNAGKVAFGLADEELPEIKSIEFVHSTVALDPRCVVSSETRFVYIESDTHTTQTIR